MSSKPACNGGRQWHGMRNGYSLTIRDCELHVASMRCPCSSCDIVLDMHCGPHQCPARAGRVGSSCNDSQMPPQACQWALSGPLGCQWSSPLQGSNVQRSMHGIPMLCDRKHIAAASPSGVPTSFASRRSTCPTNTSRRPSAARRNSPSLHWPAVHSWKGRVLRG